MPFSSQTNYWSRPTAGPSVCVQTSRFGEGLTVPREGLLGDAEAERVLSSSGTLRCRVLFSCLMPSAISRYEEA